MDNSIVCKAKIKPKKTNLLILSLVLLVVVFIMFYRKETSSMHESNSMYDPSARYSEKVSYELFGHSIVWRYVYYNDDYKVKETTNFTMQDGSLFVVLVIIGSLIPLCYCLYTAKRCSLELNDKGVYGIRKKLFSSSELKFPISKIDSIMLKKSLFNYISGGKTVVLNTASGIIKFPWVQNADEFVDATLAKIEEAK